MIPLIRRNLLMFFRDRAAVFFSLLAVLIIFALYLLFLGDNLRMGTLGEREGSRFLTDSWLIAGLLAAASITTTLGAFEIMVSDQSKLIIKDFASSPITPSKLTAGYLLSAFVVGLAMTLLTLLFGLLFIVVNGGNWLSLWRTLQVLGIIFLSVLTNTALVYFPISFIKSDNAFSTATSIIGTLTGFIAGIYLPIGVLPQIGQRFVMLFPISHSASLLRQIMMAEALDTVFQQASTDMQTEFMTFMGVQFNWEGTLISPWISILYLAGTALVFYLLSVWQFARRH
ncbi:ABC transporter, permease protein [Alkalibacterium sp. AK22]|uniref:ABC transporter permease n=1 Tax=Alkalibacterium sp. AK22 TaxID=1229520 RepID=UPI000452F321|nr:ABC transporter permease [Alkalibacterium sp. AK22]EXJ23054.1 ABC transporter, permease protein [Alkalibacterium sp. AK22]